MTALTPDQIAELRALDQARTQGKWSARDLTIDRLPHWYIVMEDAEDKCVVHHDGRFEATDYGEDYGRADLEFCAALANAAPALLDMAEECATLRSRLDALVKAAEEAREFLAGVDVELSLILAAALTQAKDQ